MSEDDLQQRDLSHLSVDQMSPAERAEMRRRYAVFMRSLGHSPPRDEKRADVAVPLWAKRPQQTRS